MMNTRSSVSLRRLFRTILLRGPIRKRWVHRQARRVEESFLHRFLEIQAGPVAACRPCPSSSVQPAGIRNIAFIADCMWEQYDLVPELRKIAEAKVLDLGPALKTNNGSVRDLTVMAVKGFVDSADWEPDVVLLYARPALLTEAVFEAIRKKWKCPVIGMNLDDKNEFFDYGIYSTGNDNYKYWASFFDLTLSNSLPVIECYKRLGLPVYYFPQGCHPKPETLQAPLSADFKYKFTFLGSWKPERGAIVQELQRRRIPLVLFGSGWKDSSWVETPELIFRQSQINLGIGFFSLHAT